MGMMTLETGAGSSRDSLLYPAYRSVSPYLQQRKGIGIVYWRLTKGLPETKNLHSKSFALDMPILLDR
jgi:hypothetical protein